MVDVEFVRPQVGVEVERSTLPGPGHVVAGERLVPRIPLDTELVVVTPHAPRHACPHEARADVIVEALLLEQLRDRGPQPGSEARADLRDRVPIPLEIARAVRGD